jgi:hypothetical protein
VRRVQRPGQDHTAHRRQRHGDPRQPAGWRGGGRGPGRRPRRPRAAGAAAGAGAGAAVRRPRSGGWPGRSRARRSAACWTPGRIDAPAGQGRGSPSRRHADQLTAVAGPEVAHGEVPPVPTSTSRCRRDTSGSVSRRWPHRRADDVPAPVQRRAAPASGPPTTCSSRALTARRRPGAGPAGPAPAALRAPAPDRSAATRRPAGCCRTRAPRTAGAGLRPVGAGPRPAGSSSRPRPPRRGRRWERRGSSTGWQEERSGHAVTLLAADRLTGSARGSVDAGGTVDGRGRCRGRSPYRPPRPGGTRTTEEDT